MIRVCPKRDAVCPHGMGCKFTIDRYQCADEPATTTPTGIEPEELARIKNRLQGRVAAHIMGHGNAYYYTGSDQVLDLDIIAILDRLALSGEPVAWTGFIATVRDHLSLLNDSRNLSIVKFAIEDQLQKLEERLSPLSPDRGEDKGSDPPRDEEIATLRAALEFYAREYSWRSSTVYMCGHSGASSAELDRGDKARAALSQREG